MSDCVKCVTSGCVECALNVPAAEAYVLSGVYIVYMYVVTCCQSDLHTRVSSNLDVSRACMSCECRVGTE